MRAKKEIDWAGMEPAWRAGNVPVLHLSKGFGVSRPAIEKHFAKLGIERDLNWKIKAKADALVAKAAVAQAVAEHKNATEGAIVEANAKLQCDIILAHRVDVPRKRELVAKLFAEIEGLTDGQDIVEQMTIALGDGDMEALAKAAQKVASLPTRIKGVSELVTAYKSLIGLERQVFGINDSASGDGEEYTEIVRRIVK